MEEHWLGATPSNREGFFSIVRALCPFEAIEPIDAAYRMAKEAHRKNRRDDGSRYFNHPRRTGVTLLADLKVTDWEWIATALLHDVREDSFMLQAWQSTGSSAQMF